MKKTPFITNRVLAWMCCTPLLCLMGQSASAITVALTSGTNNGPWTLTSGANTFNGPTNGNASIDGVISAPASGTGNILFQGNSNNNSIVIIDLNVAHSYNGNTVVKASNARAGVRLQLNNALPITTVLSLDNTTQGSGRPSWFDLNGFSQQVAGLGAQITSNYNAIVNGDPDNAGTLVVANGTDYTFNQFLGPNNAMGNIKTSVGGDGNNFSLVKSGAGTLVLTRANSYNGDTLINDGVLSIQNAYLADEAAIRLSGTATLDLDFTGTDTIGGLFFDDVPQPAGIWGATGSGAEHTSDFLSGSGFLQVIPEPSPHALIGIGFSFLLLRRRK